MTNIETFIFAVVFASLIGAACYGIGWTVGVHYVLYGYSVFQGKRGKVFVKRGTHGSGVSDKRNGNEGGEGVPAFERDSVHRNDNAPGDSSREVFQVVEVTHD